MRRFVPIFIAGAALIITACSDGFAPRSEYAEASRFNAALLAARNAVVGENATYVDVVIPAEGGIVQAGPYIVRFPAQAVCVESAGYGPDFWDAPCETTAADIPLRAAYWLENGNVMIEFLADLRFDPTKAVVIYAAVQTDTGVVIKRDILYWQRVGEDVVNTDEAVIDRSMTTYTDPITGLLYRRVKHFSGYVVSSGRECEEGVEGCEEGGGQ